MQKIQIILHSANNQTYNLFHISIQVTQFKDVNICVLFFIKLEY